MKRISILFIMILIFLSARAQDTPEIDLASVLLEDLEGKPVSLDSFRGKGILLNFWATWCKACIYEIPSIEDAKEKLGEEDVVFLLVSDEGSKKIARFVQKKGYSLKFLRLSTSFKEASIRYIPTTLLIDAEGSMVKQYIGYKDWNTRAQLRKLQDLKKK